MSELDELKKRIVSLENEMALIRKAIAAPPPHNAGIIPKDDSDECEARWTETMKHFKIELPVLSADKKQIFILLKQYTKIEVIYAIVGMRFEPRNANFNPADYVSLYRLDNKDFFDKCVKRAGKKKYEQNNKGA